MVCLPPWLVISAGLLLVVGLIALAYSLRVLWRLLVHHVEARSPW